MFSTVAANAARAAGRAASRSGGSSLKSNFPKNVVTKGMNEPNARVVSPSIFPKVDQHTAKTVRQTATQSAGNLGPSVRVNVPKNPVAGNSVKGRATRPHQGSPLNRAGGGSQRSQSAGSPPTPPGPPDPPNTVKGRRTRRSQGSPLDGAQSTSSTSTGPAMGPGFARGTHESERWRGMQDIKMAASGQAPLSTFFRTREARNNMLNSGEGAAHKWAKGSTSWGRVAGTGAAAYAGIDTLDRMGGGGSITRNETGRFDMMGIPIL